MAARIGQRGDSNGVKLPEEASRERQQRRLRGLLVAVCLLGFATAAAAAWVRLNPGVDSWSALGASVGLEGITALGFRKMLKRLPTDEDTSERRDGESASALVAPPGGTAAEDPVTRRLLTRARVTSWVALTVGLAALVGFVVAASDQEDRAAELLAHGTRVPGVVTEVHNGLRNPGHIDVAFSIGSQRTVRRINLDDASPSYVVGEPVTVVYDPRNPSRVRTTREQNESTASTWLIVLLFVGALLLLVYGTLGVRRWRRTTRLLRQAPWRPCRFSTDTYSRWGVRGLRVSIRSPEPDLSGRVLRVSGNQSRTDAGSPLRQHSVDRAWVAIGEGRDAAIMLPDKPIKIWAARVAPAALEGRC